MELPERLRLAVLAYLYGKGKVPVKEFEDYMNDLYAKDVVTKLIKDMKVERLIHLFTEEIEGRLLWRRPISYEITPEGSLMYIELNRKELHEYLDRKEKLASRTDSRTVTFWTVIIGIATLFILAGTVYLVFREASR